MLQLLPASPSLTDSAFPPFRTGNDPLTGVVLFTLLMPPQIWFRSAFADALNMFSLTEYWQQSGTVSIEDATSAASAAFESWQLMVGYIFPYGGSVAPAGTLLCDGSSYLRSDYPALFDVIGTNFGAVDGTHFNVPDLRGRVPVGVGTGSGLSPRAMGDTFGDETITLTTAEVPSHSHTDTGHTHSEGNAVPTAIAIGPGVPAPSAIPAVGVTGLSSANLTSSGGDGSHANVQPSQVINFVIAAA